MTRPPTLTAVELGTVEQVLGMGDGYVLNFSNRTFAMFFADLGIEVEAEELGHSKANRLRAFLRAGSPAEVARALAALLEHRGEREGDEHLPALGRYRILLARLQGVAVQMDHEPSRRDVLSLDYVQELVDKADRRLASGDRDGAITVSRTLVEAVLTELELRLTGSSSDYSGDLQRQYRAVAKEMNLDTQNAAVDEGFKQIARGLVQIVNGLAAIRNKASDGHARTAAPADRHARVGVNAAKTVASFLVDVYLAGPGKSQASAGVNP
jgi:hypothetical protein